MATHRQEKYETSFVKFKGWLWIFSNLKQIWIIIISQIQREQNHTNTDFGNTFKPSFGLMISWPYTLYIRNRICVRRESVGDVIIGYVIILIEVYPNIRGQLGTMQISSHQNLHCVKHFIYSVLTCTVHTPS